MIEITKIVTYLILIVTSPTTPPDFQGNYCYDVRDTTGQTGTLYCQIRHSVGDTVKIRIEKPVFARKVPVKN